MSEIPRGVQSYVDDLREVGLEPDVEQLPDRWRISVTSDHAEMRLELRRSPAGSWKWAGSSLTVDGRPQPIVKGAADLARIFREANGEAELATAEPMPTAAPRGIVPPIVQQQYYVLARRISDDQTPVLLRRIGKEWVVGFDTDRASFRMYFARIKSGRYSIDFEVIVDGVNRSAEAGGDLAQALALMAPAGLPASTPTVGSSTGRTNSAETRKGTVMRI